MGYEAFDTVDHSILLQKLYYYGIRGCQLNWFEFYLTSRKQFVSVNGVNSSLYDVKCGVPQGSTLGPLLFILYINDLHTAFNECLVHHFADDTNLLIFGKDFLKIEIIMNGELDKLFDWPLANKLSLNETKTDLLTVCLKNTKYHEHLNIKINNHKLIPVTH